MDNNVKFINERLWKQFDLLRPVLNPEDSLQIVIATLFLKIASQNGYSNNIKLGEKSRWETVVNSDNKLLAIGDALFEIKKQNSKFDHIFSFFKYDYTREREKLSNTLNELVSNINALKLESKTDIQKVITNLIEQYFSGQGKLSGEFITPIVFKDLLKSLLSKNYYETAYDPCIGVGTFIGFDTNKIGRFEANEINLSTQALSTILHFIVGFEDFEINPTDSLLNPNLSNNQPKEYDLVVAFPPFNMPISSNRMKEMVDDKWGRFRYGVSKDSNWAFVQQVLSSMKDDSEGFIILPLGALSTGGDNYSIRKELLKNNVIDAVIQLPDKLFYNTSIPVAMIILKKNRPVDEPIYFIKATELGKLHGSNRVLDADEINKISSAYKNFESHEGFSWPITVHDVMNQDYNLLPSRYILDVPNIEEIPLEVILEAIRESSYIAEDSGQIIINKLINDFGVKFS